MWMFRLPMRTTAVRKVEFACEQHLISKFPRLVKLHRHYQTFNQIRTFSLDFLTAAVMWARPSVQDPDSDWGNFRGRAKGPLVYPDLNSCHKYCHGCKGSPNLTQGAPCHGTLVHGPVRHWPYQNQDLQFKTKINTDILQSQIDLELRLHSETTTTNISLVNEWLTDSNVLAAIQQTVTGEKNLPKILRKWLHLTVDLGIRILLW